MNEYYKKLYQEYNKDPEGFEKRTSQIKQTTKEVVKIMDKFGKDVDNFLKEK